MALTWFTFQLILLSRFYLNYSIGEPRRIISLSTMNFCNTRTLYNRFIRVIYIVGSELEDDVEHTLANTDQITLAVLPAVFKVHQLQNHMQCYALLAMPIGSYASE